MGLITESALRRQGGGTWLIHWVNQSQNNCRALWLKSSLVCQELRLRMVLWRKQGQVLSVKAIEGRDPLQCFTGFIWEQRDPEKTQVGSVQNIKKLLGAVFTYTDWVVRSWDPRLPCNSLTIQMTGFSIEIHPVYFHFSFLSLFLLFKKEPLAQVGL